MPDCPRCHEKLRELRELAGVTLDSCPSCAGLWFDRGELQELLSRSGRAIPAGTPLIGPKPTAWSCPRCAGAMERGGFVSQLLVVDRCAACGGMWLDNQEYRVLETLLPSPALRASSPRGAGRGEGEGMKAVAGGSSSFVATEFAAPPRGPVSSSLHVVFELFCIFGGMLLVFHQIRRFIEAAPAPDLSSDQGVLKSMGQFVAVVVAGLILFLLGLGRMCFRLLDLAEEEDENS